MKRTLLMTVCGLGLLAATATESQAFCCLFGGWCQPAYVSRVSYYAPAACCPTACCPTTTCYAPAACCPTGGCGVGCPTGCCPTGCCPAGTATTYGAATAGYFRAYPSQLALPIVSRPVTVPPRTLSQSTSVTVQPAALARPVVEPSRQSTSNSGWEPVVVR